jgi:hypothetical protein
MGEGKMQRAFFIQNMTGKWREVERDRNRVELPNLDAMPTVFARYLFQNGAKSLHVFKPIPWAKFKYEGDNYVETKDYFLGSPDGHFAVWRSLVFFCPDVLQEELGIENPEDEVLHGKDSGPIGDLSGNFNGPSIP